MIRAVKAHPGVFIGGIVTYAALEYFFRHHSAGKAMTAKATSGGS